MKFLRVFLAVFLFSGVAFANPDPYEKIDDPDKAKEILAQVRGDLKASFGITVSGPIELQLVDPKVMDDLMRANAYKGAEIGLYRYVNGHHEIDIMKGWNRDLCSGVCAHEFTHAWQHEHCPPQQELVIKEGFARWVEANFYDKIGAYKMVENIRAVGDPIYGVGYKTMLTWEDKYGARGLVDLVQRISRVSDVK